MYYWGVVALSHTAFRAGGVHLLQQSLLPKCDENPQTGGEASVDAII